MLRKPVGVKHALDFDILGSGACDARLYWSGAVLADVICEL